MAQIDKIAFFGDSYCRDTLAFPVHKGGKIYSPVEPTYMDIFAERVGLPIVHIGVPAHGPNFMIHEFRLWCLENESLTEESTTHYVFLWSDPGRQIYKEDASHKDRMHHEGRIHPGERALMGPDTPILDDTDRFDPKVANAIRLYWLYLKNDIDSYRQYETTKLAWKYLIEKYNINSYQQYHCFFHTAKHDRGSHMFTYKGKEHRCLTEFAHGHEDYNFHPGEKNPKFRLSVGLTDDEYMNHFSPAGQISMADVCEQAYRKIHG